MYGKDNIFTELVPVACGRTVDRDVSPQAVGTQRGDLCKVIPVSSLEGTDKGINPLHAYQLPACSGADVNYDPGRMKTFQSKPCY